MYLDPNIHTQGDLVLTNDPSTLVVTRDEIKDHLRIDFNYEDDLLDMYIHSATEMAENYCGRHFIEHEYKLYYSKIVREASLVFPDCTLITQQGQNDHHPVWWSIAGFVNDFHSDDAYIYGKSNPSIVRLSSDFSDGGYPPSQYEGALFWFHFKTGFGDSASDVPQAIKQAIMLIVGDMYYFREDRKRSFPMASEILLQPYKCYH